MSYADEIADAREMIEEAGMLCQWQLPAEDVDGEKPWRDGGAEPPAPIDVPIAWFAPSDVGKGGDVFAAFMAGTEIARGSEVGLMPGDCGFDPNVGDIVKRDGVELRVTRIDRLAPSNVPIIFYVWIA